MTHQDAESIIAIATLAAMADGMQDDKELMAITEAAQRLGLTTAEAAVRQAAAGRLGMDHLVSQLSDIKARHVAFDVAVAVCNASGPANPREDEFLRSLATSMGVDATTSMSAAAGAATAAAAVSTPVAPPTESKTVGADAPAAGALDTHILDQAMLTASLELLPDRLANLAILPLQLRLVRHIGQQFGQPMDAAQIKDLMATFGLGAAAQVMESVVRKAFGGIAGGLLGGLFGGAAGVAAGGAVTFASTYALGHAAEQYYAQGRSLSSGDMKALFSRFRNEASSIYPRVQNRIGVLAQGSSLQSIIRSVTG